MPGVPGDVHSHPELSAGNHLNGGGGEPALGDQDEGGPQGRVAGERQFGGGREDPHGVTGAIGLIDEGGLGESDLLSHCTHGPLGETGNRAGHHAELVSGEWVVGEHVHQAEGDLHGDIVRARNRQAGTVRALGTVNLVRV